MPQRIASRALVGGLLQLIAVAGVLGGCASLPPGVAFPKSVSVALAEPQQTRLGAQFAAAAGDHGEASAFRLLNAGVDGLLARVQMIDAAERTVDLQYFIFRGDTTGLLVQAALVRAADRGVRVRVLVDDGDTVDGDERVLALGVHPNIEVRVFNPFRYRGHSRLRRGVEFLFNASRLDYRMHNKLLVVDNAVCLIGGRNIGNEYFQLDPDFQFADDDLFAAGPVVGRLSSTFDEYWNSALAVPAAALGAPQPAHLRRRPPPARIDGIDYAARIATGEPFAGMLAGRLPLVWAEAQVLCDSPDKKRAEAGQEAGRLMARPLIAAASTVRSELLMITPYLVPAEDELALLEGLRAREVDVRIVTNSLFSTRDLLAYAGYTRYRKPLLERGIALYEVRARIGSTRGSGQTARISRFGHYGLHAKLFVFDRRRIFIGSMNFDQRSRHLNTEIGLIVDSAELARQSAARFEAMAQPENAYAVSLERALVWRTVEGGGLREYHREPAPDAARRLAVRLLAHLPVSGEL